MEKFKVILNVVLAALEFLGKILTGGNGKKKDPAK